MKIYKIENHKFTIKDLRNFFIQIRGFPSILYLGELSGEGQNGGRYITNIAKKLEALIIKDIGQDEYLKQMNKLMKVR